MIDYELATKFDSLGFIPYDNETISSYVKRCERTITLSQQISKELSLNAKSNMEKYRLKVKTKVELIDNKTVQKNLDELNKIYHYSPDWIPVIKVAEGGKITSDLLEEIFFIIRSRVDKKINTLKFLEIGNERLPILLVVDEIFMPHEYVHAVRTQLGDINPNNFLSTVKTQSKLMAEECMCVRVSPKSTLDKYLENPSTRIKRYKDEITSTAGLPQYMTKYILSGGIVFGIMSLDGGLINSLLSLLAIGVGIENFKLYRLTEKFMANYVNTRNALANEFNPEKADYVIGRMKTEEITSLAKNLYETNDWITKREGLRWDIIKNSLKYKS